MENQSAPRFFIIFFVISVTVRAFLTGVVGKELDHLLGSLSLCLGRLSWGKGHFVLPDVWTPSTCRTVDTGDGSMAACLVEGRRIDSGNINTSRFISPLEMREPVNSLCASLRPCVPTHRYLSCLHPSKPKEPVCCVVPWSLWSLLSSLKPSGGSSVKTPFLSSSRGIAA